MSRTSRSKRAGLVVPGAVVDVAERAGELAGPVRDRVVEGASELAERAGELAERAGELAERAVELSGPLRTRVVDGAGELRVAAAPALGEALERGGAAWGALRGDAVVARGAARRWPWAVGAAVAGALAGAVVAKLMAKVAPADAPGAQEPHELRAVVDSADPGTRGGAVPSTPSVPLPAREGQPVAGAPVPSQPVASPTFKM